MGQVIPETPPDYDKAVIIERPDGVYWQSKATGKEYGPFATLVEAVEDMEFSSADSDDYEPPENLEDVEIGVSGWVDPDTGDLGESWTPRLEEH